MIERGWVKGFVWFDLLNECVVELIISIYVFFFMWDDYGKDD